MKEKSIWSRDFFLLSAANFLSWLSYNMISPVLVEHAGFLGASVPIAGVIAGSFAFASLCTRPFSGIVTDQVGHKLILDISSFLMAILLFVCIFMKNPIMLLLFRGIQGCMFGFYTTVCLVCIEHLSPKNQSGKGIGFYSLFQVVSMALGPTFGIFLVNTYGTQSCLAWGTISQFAAFLFTILVSKKNVDTEIINKKVTFGSFVETKILGYSFENFTFTLLAGIVATYLVVFAKYKQIPNSNAHFVANAVALFIIRLVTANALDKDKPANILMGFAFLSGIASLIVLGFATTTLHLILSGILKAMAQGVSAPILMSRSLSKVPVDRKGVASSTIYIGGDMGQAIAPMIGGAILENVGYTMMFDLFVIPLIAGFGVFGVIVKKNKERS